MSRDTLLESLARLWHRLDPVPDDLSSRVLLALAIDDVDVEYELLQLTSRRAHLAGARSSDEVLTFTFDSEDLSMVLRVSPTGSGTCRVDGWISPPRPMTVTATQGGVTAEAHVLDQGRFEFPELNSGATRFLLHPESTTTNLVTPAIDL